MKTKRAILIGILIWVIAILFYSTFYYIPILDNLDTQANVVLFLVVMPLVWMGCYYYYKIENKTHGFIVGLVLLLTAVALDALITVPFLVIPKGGNHYSFFTSIGFWIIAFEFLVVAILYWYTRIHPNTMISKQ